MANVIYKYGVPLADNSLVAMPDGADILGVGIQEGDRIVVWASVDPDAPAVSRTFFVRGTGHEIPSVDAQYLGTVRQIGGGFGHPVFYWHVFDGGVG